METILPPDHPFARAILKMPDQTRGRLYEWLSDPMTANMAAGCFLKDDSTPPDRKRYWNKDSRDAYNSTFRAMTPVFSMAFETASGQVPMVCFHTLWLGGEKAANNDYALKANGVAARLSARGGYCCKKKGHQ